jgi:LPXTG-site transpeptidase (sortase) family protein
MPKNFSFTKILGIAANILIIFGTLAVLLSYGPILYDEIWYWLKINKGQEISLKTKNNAVKDSTFARFLGNAPIDIDPVNTDFSIVIEKIGVNAPIVADVPVTDEKAYNEALKNGVAHAAMSQYPSETPGNVYMFAHSAINFWNFGKYALVFNLLRKLEVGDTVYVFYKQQAFIYEVVNKEVYDGWNTYPISRSVIEPILTLQTCDPPGTAFNRLIVTAKLKRVTTEF